jgi:hypothetical protein
MELDGQNLARLAALNVAEAAAGGIAPRRAERFSQIRARLQNHAHGPGDSRGHIVGERRSKSTMTMLTSRSRLIRFERV